jgi:hypothetical protein
MAVIVYRQPTNITAAAEEFYNLRQVSMIFSFGIMSNEMILLWCNNNNNEKSNGAIALVKYKNRRK